MATVINKRDVALQAATPRTVTVNLGSSVAVNGNVTGTLNGTPVADVVAAAFDSGTSDFFTSGTTNPTVSTPLTAYYNTATDVMWFKVGGVWEPGGTVNASQIITGTLAAARIAANSITSDKIAVGAVTANEIAAGAITATKLNVSTLSAITANLGTVNAGSITGTADIDITGKGVFKGKDTAGYSVSANPDVNSLTGGVRGYANSTSLRGGNFQNTSTSTSAVALYAFCENGKAVHSDGDLQVFGNAAITGSLSASSISVTSTALVSNLNADLLDGKTGSLYCQIVPTDSGTCTVSGNGFNLFCTISGYRTRGTSNFVYIEPVSDERIKQDIEEESLGLEFINKLLPVQYRLKSKPELRKHGFIAQDMRDLIDVDDDSLFQTHADGMYGVDYMSLVAPLVKAIQELSQQVKELKDGQKANCNS